MKKELFWLGLATGVAWGQKDLTDGLRSAMQGQQRTPQGFTEAAQSGASGRALTGTFAGGSSARAAFSGVWRTVAPYFDSTPALQAAFGDPQDHQVNAFFRGSFKGTPVRGLLIVGAQPSKGTAALIFDREDQFTRSLPVLSKQMSATLPKGQPSGAPSGPPQLVRTPLLDNSGFIGLAPGWQITGSYKGVVDATGPHGQVLSLGGYAQVFPRGGPQMMSGPYRPPWQAWQSYVDFINKGALSRGQASLRLIEQSQEPYPGGQAAWLSYEFIIDGSKRRGLAYIITKPLRDDLGSWFFYSSYVGGPAESARADLPTMWAMWKSWSVNQSVFRERMDNALRSMRETFQIMQDIHNNQQRAYDNANFGWDETIRGVTMIEDISTGSRTEVDTNHVDWWVNELNRRGYVVRQVPLNELVR